MMGFDAAIGGLGSAIFGGGEAAAAGGAGAALAGPTVAGTAADFIAAPTFDALSGSALAGTGADVASTAGSVLAAPGAVGAGAGIADLLGTGAAASGANSAAGTAASTGLASGTAGIPAATAPIDALVGATPTAGMGTTAIGGAMPTAGTGTTAVGGSLPSGVANANAGASVFDTSPLTGTGTGFTPAGAGTGASGVAAPTGVGATPDPTAATSAGGAAGDAGTTPAAAKSTSISDLLSKTGSNITDSLTKNAVPIALGAAGLGYNILQGQKQTSNQKALQADAATATANNTAATNAGIAQANKNATTGDSLVHQGEALTQYLQNGTLPPQYMTQIDQAINDAKTRAISNAASQGLPTDPTKNTSLASTLASIDNQRAGMVTQVAQQLFSSGAGLINTGVGAGQTTASNLLSTGTSAAGLSGQLYQALVQNDTTQAGNIGKAISTLAAALNGKSSNTIGGTNITLSQSA